MGSCRQGRADHPSDESSAIENARMHERGELRPWQAQVVVPWSPGKHPTPVQRIGRELRGVRSQRDDPAVQGAGSLCAVRCLDAGLATGPTATLS